MSYSSDRLYARLVFTLTLIAFPIALVIFGLSSCSLRKRSEKRACRAGNVEKCLEVGKFYEDKQGGIISFLMSHADTSAAFYFEACKLKSATGCERMMYVFDHGEQAKNSSIEPTDMADALIAACVERLSGGCEELQAFMDGRDWVANRSAIAFEQRCDGGNLEACYRLGALHGHELGGQHNVIEEVLPLYEKACRGNIESSCQLAQAYRDQQAALAARGSGAGGSAGSNHP